MREALHPIAEDCLDPELCDRDDRGIGEHAPFDIRHRLTASFTWDLPGEGRDRE